jgi:cytoskeletal protein CcmA (bactofilin family)
MGRRPDQIENEGPAQTPAPTAAPIHAQPAYQPVEPTHVSVAPAEKGRPMRAFTDTENLARDLKDGTISGFVGTGTTVQGEATFKGMMRIDGHLTGSIKSEKGTLIISSGGKADARIEVAVANVNGTVVGDIVATERIELGRSAHVTGNIQTPSLVIEQGAIFEGNCRMLQAQKKVEPKPEPVQNRKNEPKVEAKPSHDAVVQPSPAEGNGSNVTRIAS